MDPRGGRGPPARPKSRASSNPNRRSRAEDHQQQRHSRRPPPASEKVRKPAPAAATAGPDVFWSDDGEANPSVFTFYREGTPPPPEFPGDDDSRRGEKERRAGGGYYDGPELDLAAIGLADTERRVRMQKRWSFTVIAAAVFLVVALAVGVGVGIGVSRSINHGESTSFTAPSSTSTPSQTNTTASTTAPSSGSTTAAPASDCPAANGTVYRVPGSDKSFLRVCSVDFSGVDGAVDLRNVPTDTFAECMNNCAGTIGCTGCAWGFVSGDAASAGEHRCWMKSTLRRSHAARPDFCFGILQ